MAVDFVVEVVDIAVVEVVDIAVVEVVDIAVVVHKTVALVEVSVVGTVVSCVKRVTVTVLGMTSDVGIFSTAFSSQM